MNVRFRIHVTKVSAITSGPNVAGCAELGNASIGRGHETSSAESTAGVDYIYVDRVYLGAIPLEEVLCSSVDAPSCLS